MIPIYPGPLLCAACGRLSRKGFRAADGRALCSRCLRPVEAEAHAAWVDLTMHAGHRVPLGWCSFCKKSRRDHLAIWNVPLVGRGGLVCYHAKCRAMLPRTAVISHWDRAI